MTTTTRTRSRFHLGRALALIAEHRCACPDCDGSLALCEFEVWRRCMECGCCWKIGEYAAGLRADYFRGRCRKEER